ncbi:SIR2 family protein [Helicobacter salomonis]|uniref:SIR2 family protein n=1 Tax=Helicobacter salomonis TaxID=56878 RepID=UPI001F22771C|nr:SIR2 family protein [Helicobacter salomonis]
MSDNEHKSFIETSLANIRKAHNENYLSIFAGAGISADSGLPKWDKLMETLREKLYGKIDRSEDYRVRAKEFLEQHSIPSQKELVDFIKEIEKNLKKELCDEIKRGGDYLVLAEKFFNQFGRVVYYQELQKLIPSQAEPNDLHLEIVKLNLKNLITTNWDNLFEKAIYKAGMFFDIIKTDSDVGKSMGFSKLIKMHGSLDRRNIVFREKDYLEYSQKFPLIENYIKGVFSTDLVVLVGYSLGDPNVKQIISWVNFHSKNLKPIFFIKTNDPFEKIEFEFYKNKNIHVLYLSEFFADAEKLGDREQERKRELEYLFTKIKAQYDATPVLSNEETEELKHTLIYFDFGTLEKLAKFKKISLKDKLLRCFLLFENCAIDDKGIETIYRQCNKVSEEAFRKREFKIRFLSELNRCWGFYTGEYDKLNRSEREKSLSTLMLSEKDKLEHIVRLETYFEQRVTIVRARWEDRNFFYDGGNSFQEMSEKLREFDRVRIGNCLIIPRYESHRMAYTRALECCWYEMGCALRTKRDTLFPLLVDQEIFSHSIRYFHTKELEDIFQTYFSDVMPCIKIKSNEAEFLEKIFTNICLRFKKSKDFEARGRQLFNNFILLASYCSLAQSTFDKVLKEFNDKMEERMVNLNNGYDQLEKLIIRQSKYHRNGKFSFEKCQDLVLTFLRLFIKGKADNRENGAQSVFLTIVEKIQEINGQWIDEKHKNLIIKFLKIIHEKPPEYTRVIDNNKSGFACSTRFPHKIDSNKELLMTLSVDEFQYYRTFLPLIKALYQSSNEDVKKVIKRKLRGILKHKDQYEQTNTKKYCEWLNDLIENLDS